MLYFIRHLLLLLHSSFIFHFILISFWEFYTFNICLPSRQNCSILLLYVQLFVFGTKLYHDGDCQSMVIFKEIHFIIFIGFQICFDLKCCHLFFDLFVLFDHIVEPIIYSSSSSSNRRNRLKVEFPPYWNKTANQIQWGRLFRKFSFLYRWWW